MRKGQGAKIDHVTFHVISKSNFNKVNHRSSSTKRGKKEVILSYWEPYFPNSLYSI